MSHVQTKKIPLANSRQFGQTECRADDSHHQISPLSLLSRSFDPICVGVVVAGVLFADIMIGDD
jgi:hypothetical protein